jgi:hypothetical protein
MADEKIIKELSSIKRLMILQLIANNVNAGAIAKALKMDAGNFCREFPVSEIKKLLKKDKV